jgi:ribonuclease Z
VSQRELVLLGTASQVPTRHRNHNGYLLLWDGLGFLFDPGEGTQRQMTRYGVRASQIHRIGITHFHGDHCLGLPGLLQRISLDGVEHEVTVHYPASGEAYFERLRHASIYEDHAHIVAAPHARDGLVARGDTWSLRVRHLQHRTASTGYRLQEDDGWTVDPARLAALGLRGPAVGALVREGSVAHQGRTVTVDEVATPRPGQSVAVVMDTRLCDAARRLAEGVDLLVAESTYLSTESAEARDRGHMTAHEAATLARDAGARRLVLTHFSQRYADSRAFLEEASAVFPDVVLAEDGLRVPVPARRSP